LDGVASGRARFVEVDVDRSLEPAEAASPKPSNKDFSALKKSDILAAKIIECDQTRPERRSQESRANKVHWLSQSAVSSTRVPAAFWDPMASGSWISVVFDALAHNPYFSAGAGLFGVGASTPQCSRARLLVLRSFHDSLVLAPG